MNPLSIKPLYTFPRFTLHCEQVLQNTSNSGIRTRQPSGFFTSMVSPMGGMVQQYNTRKGNTARLLFEVLNIPPARFKTGQAQTGVATMRKEFPRAFARLAVSIPAICAHVAHACKGGAQ